MYAIAREGEASSKATKVRVIDVNAQYTPRIFRFIAINFDLPVLIYRIGWKAAKDYRAGKIPGSLKVCALDGPTVNVPPTRKNRPIL